MMIMYRYKTNCHSFETTQQKTEKETEKMNHVDRFGHSKAFTDSGSLTCWKMQQNQPINTQNRQQDDGLRLLSNYFGKKKKQEKKDTPTTRKQRRCTLTKVPEEECQATLSTNCIHLQFQLGLNRQFFRKYPTSYLLCSHRFFRWRRLFFAFIFRHVPIVCQCVRAHTHFTKQMEDSHWYVLVIHGTIDKRFSQYYFLLFVIFLLLACVHSLCINMHDFFFGWPFFPYTYNWYIFYRWR